MAFAAASRTGTPARRTSPAAAPRTRSRARGRRGGRGPRGVRVPARGPRRDPRRDPRPGAGPAQRKLPGGRPTRRAAQRGLGHHQRAGAGGRTHPRPGRRPGPRPAPPQRCRPAAPRPRRGRRGEGPGGPVGRGARAAARRGRREAPAAPGRAGLSAPGGARVPGPRRPAALPGGARPAARPPPRLAGGARLPARPRPAWAVPGPDGAPVPVARLLRARRPAPQLLSLPQVVPSPQVVALPQGVGPLQLLAGGGSPVKVAAAGSALGSGNVHLINTGVGVTALQLPAAAPGNFLLTNPVPGGPILTGMSLHRQTRPHGAPSPPACWSPPSWPPQPPPPPAWPCPSSKSRARARPAEPPPADAASWTPSAGRRPRPGFLPGAPTLGPRGACCPAWPRLRPRAGAGGGARVGGRGAGAGGRGAGGGAVRDGHEAAGSYRWNLFSNRAMAETKSGGFPNPAIPLALAPLGPGATPQFWSSGRGEGSRGGGGQRPPEGPRLSWPPG
uniref:Uncharacterized protein n=1 Tax=Ornithorhynchus anatinus TaxID=9258 RepID=A0A6I8NCE7_ORNAN